MTDLRDRLARLGLTQYHDIFAAEGFDTWETVLDITESDLSHLGVKLGHRRKLQRAIAESRGQSSDRPLPITLARTGSTAGSYRSDDSGPEIKTKQSEAPAAGAGGTSTKRKYRRHPKPDEHAPERPPSAYVIFSNQVRETLKGQDLSFTEIAKIVGEKWQVLPADEREACERQANSAKEKYYAELAEYKKTPQFEAYQKYLEDFKAKHSVPTKGKRSKLETETSTSTRADSYENDRNASRRLSSIQPEPNVSGQQRPGPSQTISPSHLPAGPSHPPKPTSPANRPPSGYNSPRSVEQFSPVIASPRSAALHREGNYDVSIPRDPRIAFDASPYLSQPGSNADARHQVASTTPPYAYPTQYQQASEMSSRRPMRESACLPPLSHEDTTLSSESGHSSSGFPFPLAGYPGQVLPVDQSKTMRLLPQPVPSVGPSQSPLDRSVPPLSASRLPHHTHDYRTQGPLAVLVRAGELSMRATNDDVMEAECSP